MRPVKAQRRPCLLERTTDYEQMTLFETYGKKYRLKTEHMFAIMCHTGGEHTFEIGDISY